MGILILSLVASIVTACVVWLIVGDRFPLGEAQKLPAQNNIALYSLMLIVPIYLTIFFIF